MYVACIYRISISIVVKFNYHNFYPSVHIYTCTSSYVACVYRVKHLPMCFTGVRIVLVNNEYTVGEEERRVEVCARIEPQDTLQRPIVATISTRDDSAEGW